MTDRKHILITGGTGFIGQALVPVLQASQHDLSVITRDKSRCKLKDVTLYQSVQEIDSDTPINVIINLAGAPISKRWSASYKKTLISSRINTTNELVALIERLNTKPELLISASAIGYYGAHDDVPLDESSTPNDEFTHELCTQWEDAAMAAEPYGVRICIARLGVVLGKNGGALEKMLPAFKLGLGGRIGNGRQMFSWIHRDDVVRAFQFLIDRQTSSGPYNLCAPNAISNSVFTTELAKALCRPAVFPMPAYAVRLLFGEMGDRLLLHGQNVKPVRLTEEGFQFQYPSIDVALQAVIQ